MKMDKIVANQTCMPSSLGSVIDIAIQPICSQPFTQPQEALSAGHSGTGMSIMHKPFIIHFVSPKW
jgi:hypothetical protein